MANIMTKRGTQDNVVTYEHMCDSHDDLANIPQNQITLGSIAIVLKDNDNQIGVYMADSNKEWLSLLTMGGNSNSSAPSTVDLLHVLTANEYDAVTHIPTIAYPETNIVYLVPSANQDDNNLFDEWIYTGESWERFGGASVSANIQPDWEQNDENAADYIKNRICYTGEPTEETLVDVISEKHKVEGMSFDAFQIMYTSESPISFDYNENDIFEFSYAGKVYYKGVLVSDGPGLLNPTALTDGEEIPPDTYAIDLSNNAFFMGSGHSSTYNQWPNSGRLVVKHIDSHIEKLNPKYLPFNIRAGDNEGIIEGNIIHNIASGSFSHAQGKITIASSASSHAQGTETEASGACSHAQGDLTVASGYSSHAQGSGTQASGNCSHAQGVNSIASNSNSHVQGASTQASGDCSHAQGKNSIASGQMSHAQGQFATASGDYSHAQGGSTKASGNCSHAQGGSTKASGNYSHTQGGATQASGNYSHAQGYNTVANHRSQHVFGQFNLNDPNSAINSNKGNYIEIVGNGTTNNARSNARTLDWDGNEWLAGTLTTSVNGIKIGNTTLNEIQLQALLNLLTN